MSRSVTLTPYRLTRALVGLSHSDSARYPPFPGKSFASPSTTPSASPHPALLQVNRHQHLAREILQVTSLRAAASRNCMARDFCPTTPGILANGRMIAGTCESTYSLSPMT